MNLKVERVMKGLTQDELSKKSGVCRGTISSIEKNGIDNTQVVILKKLAQALSISVTNFFD